MASELGPVRTMSSPALRTFILWTTFWWGLVVVWAGLFFVGQMSFVTSSKLGLYGVSIWLNGWIFAWFSGKSGKLSKMEIYHDCLCVWLLSYGMTNFLWEMPWVILSPFVFKDLHTLDDIVAYEPWMRESIVNMYWWVLASFGAVDLRTVNHDGSFYCVEIFCFSNVLSTVYFFYLNKKRSVNRCVSFWFCCSPLVSNGSAHMSIVP